jgi:hypothetical protein
MRQFALLLLFAIGAYGLWQFISTRERNLFRSILSGHGTKVFLIIAALVIVLVAQFFLNSTKLL